MDENNNDLYKFPDDQINEIKEKNEISEKINSLEEKSKTIQEKYEILGKISNLSKILGSNYDVKVAINSKRGIYFLQINGNNLDIAVNTQDKLENISKALEKGLLIETDDSIEGKIKKRTGLGDYSLKLNGDLISRSILINNSILPDYFDDNIINAKESKLSKNEIEEIFIFIMNIKGIKKEDWNIASTVCKNNTVTEKCKDKLGIHDINTSNN
ncbi:MAG: hypothetical protein PHR68_05240 [Candidatus Gracilibacteria bacterium]|nr:hypothetical protein [Candidatus Gracilibacteria bacterium]